MARIKDFISGGENNYFSPGIYTNVLLKEVKKEKEYIDLIYVTTDNTFFVPASNFITGNEVVAPSKVEGAPLKDRKRVFIPSITKVFKFEGETAEEAFKREEKDFIKTFANILVAGMSMEDINNLPEISSLEEVVDKVIALMKKTDLLFNIKVRFNKDLMYSEIPGKGTQWFEKAMGDDHYRLSFSTWEKAHRLTPAFKGLTSDDIF